MNITTIKKILKTHPFIPPFMLHNTHIQTFLGQYVPYFLRPTTKIERKLIHLPDNSQIAADCMWQHDKKQHATIVILNGLEGYRGKGFSRFEDGVGKKAHHLGFNVISLKQRAEADTIPLTTSLFTTYSGLNDIKIAFENFFRWGLKKLYLIGISYGAYLALLTSIRLMKKNKKYASGIVAIAPQVSMLSNWKHIEKSKLYDLWLLDRYKNFVKRRAIVDPPGTWDLKKLAHIQTKRQFAETYIHTFGHPNTAITIEELNALIDAEPILPYIQIPTLIITAFDDPISPIEPYTKPEIENNPNLITYLTKHGGHGGYIAGKKFSGDLDGYWAQNRALEFIKLLEKQ